MRWADGVTVVGFDGDDTLWHCEDAFAAAQEQLAGLLAEHADGSVVAARLQDVERRNLELFGYGVKGFTLSMVETAIEVSRGRLPIAAVQQLLDVGREMLRRPVQLLPDVERTLVVLSAGFRLVLVTKGDLWNQESKIARSGLAALFEAVHIVGEKDTLAYRRVLARAAVDPDRFLMVGNSVQSDVQPVIELGGWAAYVPYPVTSAHEQPATDRVGSPRERRLARLGELPGLLAGSVPLEGLA
jgi:putative hydrolase of the HAD superfamily